MILNDELNIFKHHESICRLQCFFALKVLSRGCGGRLDPCPAKENQQMLAANLAIRSCHENSKLIVGVCQCTVCCFSIQHVGFSKNWICSELPSGKHTKNYGKSPFSMGKSTISMAIFNSYVKLPEGTAGHPAQLHQLHLALWSSKRQAASVVSGSLWCQLSL